MAGEDQLPPAQWLPDPHDPSRWRWWDGAQWTDQSAAREVGGDAPPKPRSPAPVIAQVGVLFVTGVLGIVGFFVVANAWFAALAQAAIGIALVGWLAARRHGRAALVVPLVSFALTLGLVAVSKTEAVACNDQALAAFEELPPPPDVSLEVSVSPSQGCIVYVTSARLQPTEIFDHYRSEFEKQGWRIDDEDGLYAERDEGLYAERNDVYIDMVNAEGTIYVVVGRCGDWGGQCLLELGR